VGFPASLALVFFTIQVVFLQLNPAPGSSGATGNQLIDLGMAVARGIGKVLSFFGEAAKWLFVVLAVVALVCLVFSVLLFYTSRGLQAGRNWSRIAGIVLAVAPLLLSLLAILSTRRGMPFLLSTLMAAGSGYVIWALGWHYSD